MLKKLIARLNPFAVRKAVPHAPSAADSGVRKHEHSFSCPCPSCEAETSHLTAERLKLTQG